MKALYFVLMLFVLNVSNAQVEYRDSIYKKIKQTTHEYKTIENEMLKLDFYQAKDAKRNLPLVIYVHGGGFSGGSHNNSGISFFAKRLARMGYAFASVEYRLTMKGIGFGCDVPADKKKEAINNASLDVMNAVNHILNDNSTFGIDPKKVVLVGSSAGAETVLNLAYSYNYNEVLKDFQFAGVISMAGALISLDSLTFKNAIPTQLFHGTGDAYLPFETGPHHYCGGKDPGFMMLYGAGPIARKLKGLGTAYYLFSINGGSHSWAGTPLNRCFTEIVDFLYNDIINPQTLRQTERMVNDY